MKKEPHLNKKYHTINTYNTTLIFSIINDANWQISSIKKAQKGSKKLKIEKKKKFSRNDQF